MFPTDPAPSAPEQGALMGPWRVLEPVNSGSFGIIYRVVLASDPGAGLYAMKLAASPADARFEREAALLSRVDSPHVPRFHDAGTWESGGLRYPYVVMEWVEGVPLYQWARATQRVLTSRQALRLLAQLARALEAVHEHGLHRDVKGDNILVRGDGTAVLLDLGACWLPDAQPITVGALPPGTPMYRSPKALAFKERFWRDSEARYESRVQDDVYALGVTAYKLVTGRYPPEAGSSGKLLPPSALMRVDASLEGLILRMLSPGWEARSTAGALAQALEAAAAGTRKSLDAPLLPSPSVLPTEYTRFRGQWAWRARASALPAAALVLTMLGGLVVFLHAPSERAAPLPPYLAEEWELPQALEAVTLDAGVAEQAVASVHDVPQTALPSILSLGRPMPKTPMGGQRRPPCQRGEREIYGACWVGPIGDEKPPCGDTMYDHGGHCYKASVDLPPQPTSREP